jgi:imidazoleglycerol-phosphate dehydratase
MRTADYKRSTNETNIFIQLNLDEANAPDVDTTIPFFDHMLSQLGKHSGFTLFVKAAGDDPHHIVEDCGIAIGKAFYEALGDKKGIERYASIMLPMDESLFSAAIDISGRPYLNFKCTFPTPSTSNFESELVREFLMGFVSEARITLHMIQLEGINTHHMIENIFKALAYVLKKAVQITGDTLPTTKGVIA